MKHRLVLLFFPLLLSPACNINNEPLGARRELVDESDVGKILKTAFSSAPEDTSIAATLNTGASPYLLAGEAQNVFSEFLIVFARVTGGEVKNARLILPVHLVAGEGGSYQPTIHRVTRAWKEDSVTARIFQVSDYDPAPIGQANFPSLDSLRNHVDEDTLYFHFDSIYVQTLASDSVNVLIRADDRNVLLEYHARESLVKVPLLEVVLARTDRADTTMRFTARADAFIFRREAPLPGDRFYSGNGEKHETYLRFSPLDSVPANATVNRAVLTLNIDRDHSFITSDGFGCTILLVDSVHNQTDSLYFDLRIASTGASLLVDKDDLKAEFHLTGVVQGWLIAPQFNFGLVVEPSAPSRDLQRVAFHTAASNAALAPKLIVDYTTPPAP